MVLQRMMRSQESKPLSLGSAPQPLGRVGSKVHTRQIWMRVNEGERMVVGVGRRHRKMSYTIRPVL